MNNKNSDFASQAKSSHSQSQVGSFGKTLAQVCRQLELDYFSANDKQLAKEIGLIIAEMYVSPPRMGIRTNRGILPAWQVKEVYQLLTHDHIAYVIEHFRAVPYRINSIRSYLRTALYNSVFELEAGTVNAVRADMPPLK